MDILLCAAGDDGLGASLAAKGIAAASCDYVGLVVEAIEQRRRELLVTKHLDPLGERQIGSDNGRARS
jgi:hypothetical protein